MIFRPVRPLSPTGPPITNRPVGLMKMRVFWSTSWAGTTGLIYATSDNEDAGLGTVKSFGKTTDAVEALKNGQVDCVILDNEPAKALVAANEGLHILDTEYAVEDYAIAIAKENTDLLEKVNKALAELTADGTLQSIVDKYIK